MSFRSVKFLLMLGGAVCVAGGSATTANAGIIPYVYDLVFGPVGSQRAYYGGFGGGTYANYGAGYGGGMGIPTSYYGPSYFGPPPGLGLSGSSSCSSGACGTQAFYGAGVASNCCTPCGTSDCATGNCGVNAGPGYAPSANGPLTPVPQRGDIGPMPTYGEGASSGRAPGTTADPGFRPREPAPPPNDGAFESPMPASPASKSGAPAGRPSLPSDNEGAGATRGPALNLDDKITWRSAPSRQRLTLQPNYTSASAVRKSLYPKSDWTTLPAAATVAKK